MKKINAISNAGIEHTYYEVSQEFLKPLMQFYLNRRIERSSGVIDPMQQQFNKVTDAVPIGTKEVISYVFRGQNVVSPRSLMYYSKELNAIRFPNIGEYYRGSTFVD